MNLSGTLDDWTIVELLSMLKVAKKTGSLTISGDRSGQVHVEAGRVVAAGVGTDPVAADHGERRMRTVDTLFLLSSVRSGSFELDSYSGPDGEGWDVDELVADMTRLTELESDVESAGLTTKAVILTESINAPLTVAPEDWWAMASLVSALSLEQLESVFGRARSIRLLHTLWRLGVTETIDDEPAAPEFEVSVESDAPGPIPGPETTSDDSSIEPDLDVGMDVTRGDESWLDELAAAEAEKAGVAVGEAAKTERRSLTGVSAPASTTLTGSVMDEMRRLRGRNGGTPQ